MMANLLIMLCDDRLSSAHHPNLTHQSTYRVKRRTDWWRRHAGVSRDGPCRYPTGRRGGTRADEGPAHVEPIVLEAAEVAGLLLMRPQLPPVEH